MGCETRQFGLLIGKDHPLIIVLYAVQVTHNVACLARWMAADLYLREIDVLRFEVGHHSSMQNKVIKDHPVAGVC